jgi:putative hydrolases of HD superfamily
MITKGLIARLFEAASIQRWNDHVRPVEFTELDKQAHKSIIAYLLGKLEENERKVTINWRKLIEGGMFEFLQRVILTDIKPPVFHKMMTEKGDQINEVVLRKLQDDIIPVKGDFLSKFEDYLFNKDYSRFEKRLLRAAHYLATNWEFQIIYHTAPFVYGIDSTKEEIENQIEDHYDLIGVQKISLRKKSFGFIDLCGQLRFQQRWAQSPRIPKTSVLGHMLIVAMLSYLCSVEIDACDRRTYNNFFAGLVHDLPEVLTRDIVSPVKSSVEGMEDIIKRYEKIHLEDKILPLLPSAMREEITYFLEDEFMNKVVDDQGRIRKDLSHEDMTSLFNDDRFSPVDGQIIRACDKLAAFIEASLSIKHGIKSRNLEEGKEYIYEQFKGEMIGSVNFGQLFDYFF